MMLLRAATPATAMKPTNVAMLMLSSMIQVRTNPPTSASGMSNSTWKAKNGVRK